MASLREMMTANGYKLLPIEEEICDWHERFSKLMPTIEFRRVQPIDPSNTENSPIDHIAEVLKPR